MPQLGARLTPQCQHQPLQAIAQQLLGSLLTGLPVTLHVALGCKCAPFNAGSLVQISHWELSPLTTCAMMLRGLSAACHASWLPAQLPSVLPAQLVLVLPLSQSPVEGCNGGSGAKKLCAHLWQSFHLNKGMVFYMFDQNTIGKSVVRVQLHCIEVALQRTVSEIAALH